ncbi:MAG TPA: PEP-CTERM sorting domain-containing protein, partial [Lacipirellulaceae bacterium]|nr:PEP-CTERM sorting domain-containing protein [Lacipirellulaceae bacterium]
MPSTSATLSSFRLSFLAAMSVAGLSISSSIAVGQGLVYVDADDLFNLEPSAGGSLDDAMERATGAANATDNKWRARVFAPANSFGASGTVYESENSENSPEIKQAVTGLSSGTNYDMYAVWWSDPSNWVLRAGLTSNPGANPIYDRTGAVGTPGTLGVFANWTTPPADNPNVVDTFTGLEAATLEGNRVMLIAKIGTVTAPASGQVDVFFDDTFNLAGAGRTWFDGAAYAPAGASVNNVTATIDRTTGALTINSAADYLIDSIAIASGAGALNPSAWSPITGNLDSGGGFDDEAWQISSMTANNLAENEVAVGDGATIGPGGTATLNLGNVWVASPFEDVIVNLRMFSSQFVVPVTVAFTGGTPITFGDFDTDDDIDVDDYRVVLRGLNQTQTGQTDLQSYAMGDLTGDQITNFADLARFRDIYDENNGAGAFALLTGGGIPEPSSLLLLGLGAALVGTMRRRSMTRLSPAVVLLIAFGMAIPQADAQITYVDAIAAGMSTAANGNPPVNTVASPGFTITVDASSTTNWQIRGNQGRAADANNFSNNGNALQHAINTTTTPEALNVEVVTTMSGLNPSLVYDVFAFIWD